MSEVAQRVHLSPPPGTPLQGSPQPPSLVLPDQHLDQHRESAAVQASSSVGSSAAAQIHKFITLPFALHIDPLPSLHYQAVPSNASAASSRTSMEEDPLDSLHLHNSAIGNNLKLQPFVISPPPHSLDTISFLIQHSHAGQAIRPFADLLRLLEEADDDPHFTNLIEFFDARYDVSTGKLVGAPEDEDAADTREKKGMLGRMVTRSRRSNTSKSRKPSLGVRMQPSFSSATGGIPVSNNGSLRHRALSPTTEADRISVFEEDDIEPRSPDSQLLANDGSFPGPHKVLMRSRSPPRYAPHLVVPLISEPGSSRSIMFPVRLDIHNAARGLCPPPPAPASPQPQDWSSEVASVPSGRVRRKQTFSNHGESSMFGPSSALRRVMSPDSERSNRSGYSTGSHEDAVASQGGSSGFQKLGRQSSPKSAGQASQAGSGVGVTIQPKARRRASALSRFFGVRKGSRQRESSSGSNGSHGSEAAVNDEDDIPPVPPIPDNFASPTEGRESALSPTPIDTHLSGLAISPDGMRNAPSPSNAGPPTSFGTAGTMDMTGNLPHEMFSLREENALEDDEEGLDATHWAGIGLGEGQSPLPDFLALFREAAETALRLPPSVGPPQRKLVSKNSDDSAISEKKRGKMPEGAFLPSPNLQPPRTSPGLYPPGSPASHLGQQNPSPLPSPRSENADDDDNLFLRCRAGETDEEKEPWWPSGGVDPLPVAILSALSQAFGWQGILRLCYGPGSPCTLGSGGGELGPLGRAAAKASAPTSNEAGTTDATSSASTRTWSDWNRLFLSLSRWMEVYEMTRVRSGLSREIGLDPLLPSGNAPSATQAQYSLDAGILPSAVVSDASQRLHAYRRRMGIPEGLPCNVDGLELSSYRWSRSKLGPASVATPLTLAAGSLAHYFTSLSTSEFTYSSAWELDYLEAQVLHSPILAERFPPPISRTISPDSHPFDESRDEHARAAKTFSRTCPNPSIDGSLDSSQWEKWLKELETPCIVTPFISLQAWWTVIAILNGGGGGSGGSDSDKGNDKGNGKGTGTDNGNGNGEVASALDLQILSRGEGWDSVGGEVEAMALEQKRRRQQGSQASNMGGIHGGSAMSTRSFGGTVYI